MKKLVPDPKFNDESYLHWSCDYGGCKKRAKTTNFTPGGWITLSKAPIPHRFGETPDDMHFCCEDHVVAYVVLLGLHQVAS